MDPRVIGVRRSAGRLTAAVVGVFALASCGVGGQADPEPIPRDEVPFDLTIPSTSSSSSTTSTSGTSPG